MAWKRKASPKIVADAQHIRAWLKGTAEGKKLVEELTQRAFEERHEEKCRACLETRLFYRVLVVMRRLGEHPGVEVYSDPGVRVKVVELPNVESDVKEIEPLLRQLLVNRLPKYWRDLVLNQSEAKLVGYPWHGNTAERILEIQRQLNALRLAHEMARDIKEGADAD